MTTGARVRHRSDGQIGFIVEEDGARKVRLDRRAENRLVPYKPEDWLPADAPRLAPAQVARVAYDADRTYRVANGEYGVTEWLSLRDQQRTAWIQGGPDTDDETRLALYRAVTKVLAGR